jgi:translation elongation factor EF-Tu-like GTPase
MTIKALVSMKPTNVGGRTGIVKPGYRPTLVIESKNSEVSFIETEQISPGGKGKVLIKILQPRSLPVLAKDMIFEIMEGNKIVGAGIIMNVIEKSEGL